MVTETDERTIATRRLILHDSLAFLSLVLVTVVLFAITLFLFRSFSARREDLARGWSERGAQALKDNQPQQAIVALRTALSYAPGERQYELLLAQALGAAGDTEESYNYFMGLWSAEPGNGFINLQLARLERKRGDHSAAVNFYRASIYGTWEGDGVARRAEGRLELARYLISLHELAPARLELLIAGGNVPNNPSFDIALGQLLEQAADPADASTYYQKALAANPRDAAALEAAGRLAFQSGDFEAAHRMLERAEIERVAAHQPGARDTEDSAMIANAARILELMPSRTLPARERVAHILAARAVAKKRFDACSAEFAAAAKLPSALQALGIRWSSLDGTADASALAGDPARQDSTMQLVFDTETQTAKLCSTPTGDDALLLQFANSSAAPAAPPAPPPAAPVELPPAASEKGRG